MATKRKSIDASVDTPENDDEVLAETGVAQAIVLKDGDGTEVGRITWDRGQIEFEGKLAASARALLFHIRQVEQQGD